MRRLAVKRRMVKEMEPYEIGIKRSYIAYDLMAVIVRVFRWMVEIERKRDSLEFAEKQQQQLRLSLPKDTHSIQKKSLPATEELSSHTRKWVNETCSIAVFPQIDGCRWLINYPSTSPRKVYASGPRHFYPNLDTLPESMDWRSKGAIMKIKDQTDTNSCTAQTLTSCMESLIFMQTGEKVILSAKEIVDCCEEFDFETEADYPWTKEYSPCRLDAFNSTKKFYIDGYATVPVQNESWMELAIAQQPVAVELWLVKEDYESYKEDKKCAKGYKGCLVHSLVPFLIAIGRMGSGGYSGEFSEMDGEIGFSKDELGTGRDARKNSSLPSKGIYSTEYKFDYVLHMMAAIGYNSQAWIFLNSRGVGYGVDGCMYVKRGMDLERYPEGIGRVSLNVTYPIMNGVITPLTQYPDSRGKVVWYSR
ncbi:unnamed protein product [Dovyalis caffra]|uniref:Peptidase C1A papain C-terminal domain-containing protein n=1 Tax=Dovyalis caffra TaxID=77055 RepID=A0AAV1RU96_9ROSI|nr:unnamed protein product [Dovyalis caffra]